MTFSEADLERHIEEFKKAGRQVEKCPAQRCNPRKFETVSIPKRQKKRKAGKNVSGYGRERIPKSEALGARMNLKSTDHTNVPSTSKAKIEVGEIYGALAMAGMRRPEQELYIYYHTQDHQSWSAAKAFLMTWFAGKMNDEGWEIRKPGLMTALVETALDEMIYPTKYKEWSVRQYCRAIGLKNSSHWSTYGPRYTLLSGRIDRCVQLGDRVLARQL